MNKKKPIASLADTYPKIAKQWHPTKNDTVTPSDISATSNRKVWWVCDNGHAYERRIADKVRRPDGKCPICTKRTPRDSSKRYGTLAEERPQLVEEWNFSKNGSLTPSDVSVYSSKSVWWKCPSCGHEWKARIQQRSRGSSCPHCMRAYQTSFPEQALYYYLSKQTSAESRCLIGDNEVDIYLPNLNIAVEYNSHHWHKRVHDNKPHDDKKKRKLEALGIRLITVMDEFDKNEIIGDDVHIEGMCTTANVAHLPWAIQAVFDLIGIPCPTINLHQDEPAIANLVGKRRSRRDPKYNRTASIQIRITPDEKTSLEQYARDNGYSSVAAVIRERLSDAFGRSPNTPQSPMSSKVNAACRIVA